MKQIKHTVQETHPLFPSGEWEGFFTYEFNSAAKRYPMAFYLNFENDIIAGMGSDNVGGFKWKGAYDTDRMLCTMTKFYTTHSVFYKGHVDENGIWGTWFLGRGKGGFHIWPKANQINKKQEEVKILSIKKGLVLNTI